MRTRFELISFPLCPFVQRSAITLLHKQVDFKRTEIDLASPPGWFLKISPLGKVPLLRIAPGAAKPETILFESAVINEYVDEVSPPRLMPDDPLDRALQRAWIEFGSELLGLQYRCLTSQTEAEAQEYEDELFAYLAKLELAVRGPLFAGSGFSLVDSTFAPLYTRFALIEAIWNDGRWKSLPKVRTWAERLIALPEVIDSVDSSFEDHFLEYLKRSRSALAA